MDSLLYIFQGALFVWLNDQLAAVRNRDVGHALKRRRRAIVFHFDAIQKCWIGRPVLMVWNCCCKLAIAFFMRSSADSKPSAAALMIYLQYYSQQVFQLGRL